LRVGRAAERHLHRPVGVRSGGAPSGRRCRPRGRREPLTAATASAGGSQRGALGPAEATSLEGGAAKIRIAELTVAIRDADQVAAKADAAGDIALRAGGDVDADDRISGPRASATLRLRVPPSALHDILRDLSRLGEEKSRTLSTTDVTEKVADVKSRVASARGAIAWLRAFYDRAAKVSDMIAVEPELATREADLESLQAQQRTLVQETAQAAITLTSRTAPKPPPPPAEKAGGFLGGLQRGWDGFTAAAAWVAPGLGTVLPFLLLALAVAAAARFGWGRLAGRHPAPTPTPPE
jgi:hypothetical protein